MLIKPSTGFAHPILAAHSSDYGNRQFEIILEVDELPTAGEARLTGRAIIDDDAVISLVRSGSAVFGLMCECPGTYFQQFSPVDLDGFVLDFKDGTLRGQVSIQGVIVAVSEKVELRSSSIVAEYPAHTRVTDAGDLLALTAIHTFEAGLEKLLPMESIFRLASEDSVKPGHFRLDLDSEAIVIRVHSSLYDTIYQLRGTRLRDVLLPSLYLPVVMSVLDAMKAGEFPDRRWNSVMTARCSSEGINIADADIAMAAQELLDGPMGLLKDVFKGVDQ